MGCTSLADLIFSSDCSNISLSQLRVVVLAVSFQPLLVSFAVIFLKSIDRVVSFQLPIQRVICLAMTLAACKVQLQPCKATTVGPSKAAVTCAVEQGLWCRLVLPQVCWTTIDCQHSLK